jgi:hypothetical protein
VSPVELPYYRENGREGEGEEPNQTMTRKPGPLQIIQYSLDNSITRHRTASTEEQSPSSLSMVLMGRCWRSLGFLGWREQMAGQLCGHLLTIQLHPEDKTA